MMRYVVVTLVALVWAQLAYCKNTENDFNGWLKQRGDALAEMDTDSSAAHVVKRDISAEKQRLLKMLLPELVRELKHEGMLRNLEAEEDDLNREFIDKRKAFWQPMGGPLPVETRLASFGSRIEPNRNRSGPSGLKAMRYGRR